MMLVTLDTCVQAGATGTFTVREPTANRALGGRLVSWTHAAGIAGGREMLR